MVSFVGAVQSVFGTLRAVRSYVISGVFLGAVLCCALVFEAYDRLTRPSRPAHQERKEKPSKTLHHNRNHTHGHNHQHNHQHGHASKKAHHQRVPAIVHEHGYHMDTHRIHTEDGHILALQHIHPRQNIAKKIVVILQHGLLQSSAVYVMNEEKSLGFVLANQGLDVWLSNTRTNIHCSHSKIKKTHQSYWNYTIDDLGKYDFPAIVRFVLKKTGAKKVIYIGHSQGVTKAIAGLNFYPKLNKKIQLLVALNPGVYVRPMSNIVVDKLAKTETKSFFDIMGNGEFLPMMETIRKWIPESIFSIFAYSMSSFMFGWNDVNWNTKQKPMFFSHTPAGASVANVAHWFQIYQSNKFQMFDYGEEENMKRYGQHSPPQYDLGKVQCPVALVYGGKDFLVDSERVAQELQTIVYKKKIDDYEHMDALWSVCAVDRVYPELIEFILQHDAQSNAAAETSQSFEVGDDPESDSNDGIHDPTEEPEDV